MTSFLPLAESVLVAASEFDTVYQSASNTLKSASRVVSAQTFRVDLANRDLGGTQMVDLPQGQLLSTTVLALKFTKEQIGIANLSLRDEWVYDAIEYIEYAFAGSEKLIISGAHMLQKHLADCESGAKRAAMMDLNGNTISSGSTPEIPVVDVVGYLNLYLPFSNVSSSRVIPFDSGLISRPVRITIKFAQASSLFCVPVGQTLNALAPKFFASAYIMCKTALLKDEADSIKDLVGPMGSSQYSYGYIYPLGWESSETVGHYPASANTKASVRIQGFQNGSVGSIDLWLKLYGYNYTGTGVAVSTAVTTRDSIMNRNLMLKMRNIEVLYAGQVIWASPDEIDIMFSLSEFNTANTFPINTGQNNFAVTGTVVPTSTTSTFYHVQLSQFHESMFTNLVQSGTNFTNNTVEIRFNTPELSELPAIAPEITRTAASGNPVDAVITAPTYKLFANLNYQASVLIAKGAASTVFAPPIPVLASTLSF